MKSFKVSAALCLLFIVSSLLYISCKKQQESITAPADLGYVPTDEGRWVVYDVDSIVHADNDGNTDDSVRYYHFQVKEVISGTFKDGEGRPTQRISRYHRSNSSSDWQITNVWTTTVTASRVERTEENIKYISLAFPINSSITWDGNAFNTLGEQDYIYDGFHEPFSIGDFNFDSTLTVIRADDDNFVEQVLSKERYAVHVGLIYKEYRDLLKNAGQVVSGLEYTETVAEYGN